MDRVAPSQPTVLALCVTLAVVLHAQDVRPPLRFDVASVKRSDGPPGGSPPSDGVLAARGATVEELIIRAYDIKSFQLEGAPSWVRADSFDIVAKAPTASATESDMFEMVRNLLADRFGLRAHFESRQAPVYKLRLARADGRLGPGLTRTSPECERALEARKTGGGRAQGPSSASASAPICGISFSSPVAGNAGLRLLMGGMPLAQLVPRLASDLGVPVVDETGLAGRFDIVVEYERVGRVAAPSTGIAATATDLPPPPLQSAIQVQLGLKLERETGPMQVLVIETVHAPTPD
jgi:uncharacterized protein (TIGR03435 family)